jgi:hypothetical protein
MTNAIIAKMREWANPVMYDDITETRDALYDWLYCGEPANDMIGEVIRWPRNEGDYDRWATQANNVAMEALNILDRWLKVFGRAALETETVNAINYFVTDARSDHEKIESVHLRIQRHWRELNLRFH